MQLSIRIQNAAELQRVFYLAPTVADKEFRGAMGRIASTVQSHAMRNAPVGKNYSGGGNLRQSIHSGPTGTGYMVEVRAAYGVFVDQGTRPHVIYPRRSQFLAFQVDGKWVFTRRVNHPGTQPTHFFTNAVEAGQQMADNAMDGAMQTVLNTLK